MFYQLDLQSYQCPIPLLATQQALKKMKAGESISLVLNPISSVEDFRLLCEQQGYQLLSVDVEQHQINVLVRK